MPEPWEKEFQEQAHYASGRADAAAAEMAGDAPEPWLKVIETHEPSAFPSITKLLNDPALRPRIRGAVIDVGAGTCILSAQLSQLPEVSQVFALDLSEEFLTTTSLRILRHAKADESKMTFVASDFNAIPLPTASIDAAFIFAAIHHSLSPIKTLQEVGRLVKPGGTIFILENPSSVLTIRERRRNALAISEETTEIAYTLDELRYVIDNANIGTCDVRVWDVMSRPGPRRWLRAIARWAGLEHVLLAPPNYMFVITRR